MSLGCGQPPWSQNILVWGKPADILDTEPDEPHLVAGKAVARTLRTALERTGLPSLLL